MSALGFHGHAITLCDATTGHAVQTVAIATTAKLARDLVHVANAHEDLVAALRMAAWFIENVNHETADATAKFFEVREAWRNALAKVQP